MSWLSPVILRSFGSTGEVYPEMRRISPAVQCLLGFIALWLGILPKGLCDSPVQLIGAPQLTVTGSKGVLQWNTDRETGTSIVYGPAVERPTRRFKGKVGKGHWAELDGLEPATRYRVVLGTAREPLQTNEFVTPPREALLPVEIALTVVVPPPRSTNAIKSAEPPPTQVRGQPAVGEKEAGPTVARTPPPLKQTWAHPATVADHFRRHGADFHARDPEDYAAQAWRFRQAAAASGYRVKKDSQGILRIYDPTSGTFGAYNPDGTTRTFFKPGTDAYFDRQPGKVVVLHE